MGASFSSRQTVENQPSTTYIYGLRRTVAPTVYPVTVDEAKEHLRVIGAAEDAMIERLIRAATDTIEQITNKPMVDSTYLVTYDDFPTQLHAIELPRAPGKSLISFIYGDKEDGAYPANMTTVPTSDYRLDFDKAVPRITPRDAWPTDNVDGGVVQVTYIAGYAAPAAVTSAIPYNLIQAVLLLVGHFYENREEVLTGRVPHTLPFAVQQLIATVSRDDVM